MSFYGLQSKEKKSLSVFKPVRNIFSYQITFNSDYIDNSEEKKPNKSTDSETIQKSSEKIEKKEPNKRKWTMEDRIMAVNMTKKLGVTKTISFLTLTEPERFGKLSTSTLQYWINQSKGRKRRYYE